ncbi:hypothetical protein PYCCODRAFT_1474235 [Trametes coccinea BRFM310]|uniref:GRF-type domain-containing protein n=1 Tax=Trametes coccinea (strain BRFM310) TaxID=1353009 RepID=A0A1Y2J1N7_TRAC3|nr:hypothetical protein PYCCODRAFT_1474235 [Trametes coccinea BRFM310]
MSQSSTHSVQTFVNDVAPVNDEGQVVCYHRLPAKRMTSRTPTNPNRDFFSCSKNRDDPDKCKFFVWADDPKLCSALQSKRGLLQQPSPATPERPSQAKRALFSRSPTMASASYQKRHRTPSPTPDRQSASDGSGGVKHRKVGGAEHSGHPLGGPTPSDAYSQQAVRVPDSERAAQDERRAARLKSIQDALLAVQATPRDPSPASSSGFVSREHIAGPSRLSSYQRPSDVPSNVSTPASLSQNIPSQQGFSRPPQDAQSDAGTSIYAEVELAEMEDMESRAVQTSPIDDDGSMFEDEFWSSPPRSVIGLSAPIPEVGTGSSREGGHRVPDVPPASAADRSDSSMAPQTPGRSAPSRVFSPGGNESERNPSMLLTPPPSSQPLYGFGTGAGPSAAQRGRAHLLDVQDSPTASKGKRPERSDSSGGSQSWRMLQHDPENPFLSPVVSQRGASPAPTAISVADSVGGTLSAGALSADSIASHIAALQSLPEYISKLERREKAARKSAEIKGRKICELEEEVQRLRKEKRALEETVAALQMRR